MPMPLEILVQYVNGNTELHYIPISLMRGEKENTYELDWEVHPDWRWASKDYTLLLNHKKNDVEAIVIDPSNLMADIDKSNNFYEQEQEKR